MTEEKFNSAQEIHDMIQSLKSFIKYCETFDASYASDQWPLIEFEVVKSDKRAIISEISLNNLSTSDSENILIKHLKNALQELETNFENM